MGGTATMRLMSFASVQLRGWLMAGAHCPSGIEPLAGCRLLLGGHLPCRSLPFQVEPALYQRPVLHAQGVIVRLPWLPLVAGPAGVAIFEGFNLCIEAHGLGCYLCCGHDVLFPIGAAEGCGLGTVLPPFESYVVNL